MKLKAGRNYGVAMLALAWALGLLTWALSDLPIFFTISTVTPFLVVVGLALLAFPGGAPVVDLKAGQKLPKPREVWAQGSGLDKAIWGVAAVIGGVGVFVLEEWLKHH